MSPRTPIGRLGLLPLLALPALAQEPQGQVSSSSGPATVQLRPKAHRSWDILLPQEKFVDVGSGFTVPHQGGDRFAAKSEGELLRADLDGNGEFEAIVEGETAFLTFTGKSTAGNKLVYSARLERPNGRPWRYSCGGAMTGDLGGTRIQFFDQNLNGRYDDYGEDAVVIGRDSVASFLSKVIAVDGRLYSIEVQADGSSFSYTPYTGPSGLLDLNSQLECKAKLRGAIVTSVDGQYSFNAAAGEPALRVPAGRYVLHNGEIVLGDAHATLATGRAQPIEVKADEQNVIAWGGPVQAEFAFHRDGDQVGFAPAEIWYYGKQGESFFDFMPLGKSPDFTIKNKQTGEVITVARFPGNC